MNLRLFVAVELPEAITLALGDVQAELRREIGESVRWTDPRGTHLTLRFLGDTDEQRLPEVERALTEASRGFAAFSVTLAGTGCFPNGHRPRVLWVGLTGQMEELARLQASVDMALTRQGFPREERPFSPHLTLGRVRDGLAPADLQRLSRALASAPTPPATELPVTEVSLMRSELGPKGATYTSLYVVRLAP